MFLQTIDHHQRQIAFCCPVVYFAHAHPGHGYATLLSNELVSTTDEEEHGDEEAMERQAESGHAAGVARVSCPFKLTPSFS